LTGTGTGDAIPCAGNPGAIQRQVENARSEAIRRMDAAILKLGWTTSSE
jgi:hypothetical protein